MLRVVDLNEEKNKLETKDIITTVFDDIIHAKTTGLLMNGCIVKGGIMLVDLLRDKVDFYSWIRISNYYPLEVTEFKFWRNAL